MAMNVLFQDNLTREQLDLKVANAKLNGRSKPSSFTTLPKGIGINANYLKHTVNGVEQPWYVYGEFDTEKGKRYVSGLYMSGVGVMGTGTFPKFFVDLSEEQLATILNPANAGKLLAINTTGYIDPVSKTEKVIAKFDAVAV